MPRAIGNGTSNVGDTLAAGRGRQRLKLAALSYASARHGIDAQEALVRQSIALLCKIAFEFVEALQGALTRGRSLDPARAHSEMLQVTAIAYAAARHGIDADVGMAREGLAMLCQAAIDFVGSLPVAEVKRSDRTLQISQGS